MNKAFKIICGVVGARIVSAFLISCLSQKPIKAYYYTNNGEFAREYVNKDRNDPHGWNGIYLEKQKDAEVYRIVLPGRCISFKTAKIVAKPVFKVIETKEKLWNEKKQKELDEFIDGLLKV